MGQRYGLPPSSLLGLPPDEWDLNLRIAALGDAEDAKVVEKARAAAKRK